MSSRRLLALMCAAVLGVLVALGLVVAALAGPVGAAVYAVVALAVVLGGGRARPPAARAARAAAGRTCTCCTTTHFDPVKVI